MIENDEQAIKPEAAGALAGEGHVAMLRSLRLMYDDGVMDAEDHPGTVAALDAAIAALSAAPVAAQEPVREEMSPDFTDSARAAIAWVLFHHQGGSSPVGQPLRFALGMGKDEPLPDWRIAEAKAWAAWGNATTADFHAQQPAVVGDGGLSRSLKLAAAEEQAEAWHAVCGLLSELSPGWAIGPGSGQERALAVIRAALTPAATPELVGDDGLRLPTLDGFRGLHPDTLALVRRFAYALACKLSAAERKYGYSDAWASPDWMDECRQKLVEHVAKGDPRDVAAYCAFLWHHDESTAATPVPVGGEGCDCGMWLGAHTCTSGGQQGPVVDEAVVGRVARAIFAEMRPDNLRMTDWDRGSILGRGNAHRIQAMNAARAAIDALAHQPQDGRKGEEG